MYGIRRTVGVVAGVVALSTVGVMSAQAWTWASSSNPIVMSGGGGYGTLGLSGTKVTLTSTLRDTKVGDGRVYAKVWGNNARGTAFTLSSGQRSDGESSYAKMLDKSINVPYGTVVGNYSYQVRTCRSVTLSDPCSDDYRRYP